MSSRGEASTGSRARGTALIRWHIRCVLAAVTSYLFGSEYLLFAIGTINRHILRGRITGVFLLYPARKEYADALAYEWHQKRFAWRPGLVGSYSQDGRLGLIFGIPNLEDELRDQANAPQVLDLLRQMDRISNLIGAPRRIFAGILPSQLARLGITDSQLESQRELTARAVVSALDQVIAANKIDANAPILLIGGKGYIASKVMELCSGRLTYSIDVGEFENFRRLATGLRGSRVVVVNLAKSSALAQYVPHFWPGVIVLNEVYPEPTWSEVADLTEKSISCFHVVGVAGKAWPPFPRAYRGGIPCCAALPPPGVTTVTALVTQLLGDSPAGLARTYPSLNARAAHRQRRE